ncbi:MAG: nucleotidyltransferase domain-containing protein [Methanosarcinales archaeon]
MDIQSILGKEFIEKVKIDENILAVILFGSYATHKQKSSSDIDICIVLNPNKYSNLFMSEKKLEYLMVAKNEKIDVHIFQQLPLYIRIRILEGIILLCKNYDLIYKIAFQTIKEFEYFKKYYYEYLESVMHG